MHCALCCRTIVFSPGINQLREAFRKTADKGLSLTRPRLAFFHCYKPFYGLGLDTGNETVNVVGFGKLSNTSAYF